MNADSTVLRRSRDAAEFVLERRARVEWESEGRMKTDIDHSAEGCDDVGDSGAMALLKHNTAS